MQPNALKAPARYECRHPMCPLVDDRYQQAGVGPDRARQYEGSGDSGGEGDDQWCRRRLVSSRTTPDLCYQLHPPSIADDAGRRGIFLA